EPGYNQKYDDNYYPHESLSFLCCDYCGGSYETFQCQPDNQNVDFSGSDQVQTPQYPDVNPPSLEIKKPQILFQTWETFFAIQCSQPEDSNELFQKLLKDLKDLAEYDQSTSTDRPIFLNDIEDHPVQNEESPENSSEETVVSKTNQEPPQDLDIHQLIEECCIKFPEVQKQKMENTMFELVKICQEKEFLCIHDDIDDLIESALNSKLLLINSNSQRLDKVVHKSSISFKDTSQISSIRSVAPIQLTEEPKNLLSMGYEHLSITPKTKSDKVTESNDENLLPIPSKCEVTLEDEIECDMPAKDDCSPVFTTFSNPLFKNNDNLDSSDDKLHPDENVPAEEFKIYSNPLCDEDRINSDKLDPHCFNVESDFVESLLNHDTFIDFSSKFDFSGELAHIKLEIPKSNFDFEEEIRLIKNLLYDNSFPRPPEKLNAGIADTIIESIPLPILKEIFVFWKNYSSMIPFFPMREEIPVVMNDKDEDVDYSSFIFVVYPEMFSFLLSAESEDTIFDPGLFPEIEVILCRIYVRFPRSSYPFIDYSLGKSISF
nr:hypothetical protein [Tanacetum cinerariifolium]